MARALWITAPRTVALCDVVVEPGAGEVVVETAFSGISRGTESLVFSASVPATEWSRMRCPMQAGDFPHPVKYGYSAVGRVVAGDAGLIGSDVFCLHPHQDSFAAPSGMVLALPAGVPPARAVLAANLETALNIVWDGGTGPGDRVAVVGAGLVGALSAWLVAQLPGAEAVLVDVNPARKALAEALGCGFALPDAAPAGCDVVIHASGSAAGIATAVGCAGFEARVMKTSWYGDRCVTTSLGGAFHSQRLRLVSSQVGQVPAARRARWTRRRRLETALALLRDPALDALISGETAFGDLAGRYAGILADPNTLCHRIRYQ